MRNHAPEPRIRMEPDFEETWPGADTLATECLVNIGFLGDRLGALAGSLVRRYQIPSLAAFDALAAIDRAGEPLPPSTIAERMIVSRPTMTGTLRSLARRGLITRLPYPKDRRMALIDITPEGRALVKSVRLLLHQGERRLMNCLTRKEQGALLRMVAKLQANAPQL